MPTTERIMLKEAILVGGAPGHTNDIREGGARYAKVLYGVREPILDERTGLDIMLLAYHVTGFIFQYRFFRTPRCVLKLAASNILSIDARFTEEELRARVGPWAASVEYAEAERKAAKAVDFARAYGAEMCPLGGPIHHILGRGLTCSACIRHRNEKQTLPCGCPSDHDHGRPRPRQYCLERGCKQCHKIVPEHWHASNDGTVRQ